MIGFYLGFYPKESLVTKFRPSGKNLEKIADLVDSKVIIPNVDGQKFNLDQCIEAFQYFESQTANGKVVFDID